MTAATKSIPLLTINKKVNAPTSEVFACFTDPGLLAKWHAPNLAIPPVMTVDLRVGGSYRFQMHDMKGNMHVATGFYKEIVAEEKLVFTWRWEQGEHPDTIVTVVFKDLGDATEIELMHEGFVDHSVKEHHTQGWTALLGNLERLCQPR